MMGRISDPTLTSNGTEKMSISKRTVETLLDLVEVKLSFMQVSDREDQREMSQLESCRRELRGLMAGAPAQKGRPATTTVAAH
ncbi:MAG: hypothetical protein ACI9JL_003389 [Paracoccaceae bacterium]|jgi:hypothetical protein